jgi:hypothetical protein
MPKQRSKATPEALAAMQPTLFVLLGTDLAGNVRLMLVQPEEFQHGILPPPSAGEKVFEKSARKDLPGTPGTVYRMPYNGSQIKIGEREVVGRWPEHDQCVRWQAAERGVERARAAAAEARRLELHSELDEHLTALREAYQRAGNLRRAQLLAYVVEQICK